jgi:hypothetical protein
MGTAVGFQGGFFQKTFQQSERGKRYKTPLFFTDGFRKPKAILADSH